MKKINLVISFISIILMTLPCSIEFRYATDVGEEKIYKYFSYIDIMVIGGSGNLFPMLIFIFTIGITFLLILCIIRKTNIKPILIINTIVIIFSLLNMIVFYQIEILIIIIFVLHSCSLFILVYESIKKEKK